MTKQSARTNRRIEDNFAGAWAKLAGVAVETLNPWFVSPAAFGRHARWWIAAKSHWMAAPKFAIPLIVRWEPENVEIANWSDDEVKEFGTWAAALPGWKDGAPLVLVHQRNGRLVDPKQETSP